MRKFSLTAAIVVAISLISSLSGQAQPILLAPSPSFVEIGPLRHDALSTSARLLVIYENPNADCHIDIKQVSLKVGVTGFSAKIVGPTRLTNNSPIGIIEIAYKPSKFGRFKDDLIVPYVSNCQDANRQLSVPISADVLCTNPFEDCSPIGPLCVVDQNKQPMTKLTLDASLFSSDVFFSTIAKPLATIMREHYSTLGTYTISFQDASSAAGIGAFIEMPPADCCANCDNGCPSRLKFKRVPYSDRVAEFTWQNRTPIEFNEKSTISSVFKLSMKFPATLAGRVIISADGLEFHFNQSGPTLTFSTQGTPIYTGSVSCLRGSFYQGVVRQVSPGPHTPNLDMIIEAN